MNGAPAIAIQFATLGIVTGGLFLLVPPLRPYALRLILTGAVIASAAEIISTQISSGSPSSRIEEMIVWIGATGVIAAIFKLRRLATYMMVAAGLGFLVLMAMPWLEPVVRGLARNWWIIPVILVAPLISRFIVSASLKSLRARASASHSSHSLRRSFTRFLDWVMGSRRHSRFRDRHIGDAAGPRNGRNGGGRK